MTQTINEIWDGDLLDRKAEAELLIGYIESVAAQPRFREDAQGFTIAIDAGYGEGKTWFLKRLKDQLALNHPVAFVDAWRDDLADEPLTALVATLKKALDPLVEKEPAIKQSLKSVMAKTGAVSKIVGAGLLKRGLGLLMTTGAVDAASAVLSTASEEMKDAINDGLSEGAKDVVDNAASALGKSDPAGLMEQRVADFEAGQKAMDELKASLAALVASLKDTELQAPIVIIIDELDRCRPTYAVKLLEEVKHLFDVPGLVFIFGMHKGQLAHSVKAAYGSDFDGQAYLNRFMQRHYQLKLPPLDQFLSFLLDRSNIDAGRLWFPQAQDKSGRRSSRTPSSMISFYLRTYSASARDAIAVVEILETCCALVQKRDFFMPLLLPLILSKLQGAPKHVLVEPKLKTYLQLLIPTGASGSSPLMEWQEVARRSLEYRTLSDDEVERVKNVVDIGPLYALLNEFRQDSFGRIMGQSLFDPVNYGDLIETVGRFQSPNTAEPTP
jgi:hypothetical protein